MEPTPYLRNRRTGVILPYNEHLATHPDMVACEELPYPKERHPPERPTTRRYVASQAKKTAEAETKKTQKRANPVRKEAVKSEPEPSATAEIDDLLSGIEHG